MNLRKARIIVTGADGFIGSHLTEALVRRGCNVRAFVFYNSFNSWGWLDETSPAVRRRLQVVSGDIRDPHAVKAAMTGCDVLFHLAALIAIPHSYHSPAAYVDTNVMGTLNLLQAARELHFKKVVHTSTSEVYGTAKFVPITEEHPLDAQSPYAATKTAADQLALSFHRSFGLPVTIVRPFNTYGPRQSARAVIPTIITQIATRVRTLKLGNLRPTRDFTYVKDTVRGFIAAAASDAVNGRIIQLGTDHEISIGDLAGLIARIMRAPIRIGTESSRVRPAASEVDRLRADNQRAAALIGWRPAYAGRQGLERGLRETVGWFRVKKNLSRYKADLCNL